jgi:hypothetical protein
VAIGRMTSEADRVFARFHDETPPTTDRRETRNIPARGTRASRTVEVVHVRSGTPARASAPPQPSSSRVRAAAWDDGFPARAAPPPFSETPKPAIAAPVAPTFHLMPARSPSAPAAEATPVLPDPEPTVAARRGRGRPRKQTVVAPAKRIADPFDANDEGSNCIRCGYAVQPARERRGMMTCAGCG